MESIEFLKSARELLEKESTQEVDYRNVTSRAYYCAFHTCKKLWEDYPPSKTEGGAEHQKVINELKNHQNKQFRKLGNILNDSRNRRVTADYHLVKQFVIQDAKVVIKSVEKLLQDVQVVYNN